LAASNNALCFRPEEELYEAFVFLEVQVGERCTCAESAECNKAALEKHLCCSALPLLDSGGKWLVLQRLVSDLEGQRLAHLPLHPLKAATAMVQHRTRQRAH